MATSSRVLRLRKFRKAGFLISLLALPLAQFAIFYCVVNFNAFLLAFQRADAQYNYQFVGLANFRQIWSELIAPDNAVLRVNLVNSVTFWLAGTLVGMPLHLFIAYLVFKKVRFTGFFRIIVMIPSIISSMVMALISSRLMYALPTAFSQWGINFPKFMTDEKYAFPMIVFYSLWTGFGSSVIMYPNAMGAIDNEIIEAGRLDGCSPLQEFIRIVLPLIMPTITTYVVTGLAGIFGAQGANYVFWGLNAPSSSSTMGYYLYSQVLKNGSAAYGYTSALGIMVTLISFPVTLFVKWLLEKADPVND